MNELDCHIDFRYEMLGLYMFVCYTLEYVKTLRFPEEKVLSAPLVSIKVFGTRKVYFHYNLRKINMTAYCIAHICLKKFSKIVFVY